MSDKSNFKHGVKGHLEMTVRSKGTGEVIDQYSEDNVITVFGFSQLTTRFTRDDETTGGMYLETFHLGDDTGTGTLLNPEPENEDLLAQNQNVVYVVPVEDIVRVHNSSKEFVYNTVLDGNQIMNSLFPDEIEMRYCSATMRMANGAVFSYKRFPVRSLSRYVDIDITWTFTFAEV